MFRLVKFSALGMACIFALAGCSGSSKSASIPLRGDIEIWSPYFEETSSGHCASTDGRWERNAPLALVGPDDSVIASTDLDYGTLETTSISADDVTNFPDGKICQFKFEFSNVPKVSTYRLKNNDGHISPVVHDGGYIGEVIGADFKR